ncbi:MAG: hypothetical protein H6R19_220 [Proteobacteria bacterium]|nr:hypothetical protein [Pseudomonadota bacterium]
MAARWRGCWCLSLMWGLPRSVVASPGSMPSTAMNSRPKKRGVTLMLSIQPRLPEKACGPIWIQFLLGIGGISRMQARPISWAFVKCRSVG